MPEPLSVAIVNDYEIVVAGVAAALEPFEDRVRVVELDSSMPVVSDVDVVLYDTFGQTQGDGVDVDGLLDGHDAKVVIFSWNTQSELVERALAQGAAGYLSKQLGAAEIVAALEEVAAGRVVRPPQDQSDRADEAQQADRVPPAEEQVRGQQAWPGREHGLSVREAEVIALISQGLSNQQIADRTYLSINSVKTYIRSAYRKIRVESRAQAVIWGLKHGFEPDSSRHVRGDAGRDDHRR